MAQNVAKVAASGEHLRKASLELGGNAPLVVLDDADLDAAVGQAVAGTFLHSGQICMSVNRIIVEAPVYDEFVSRFTQAAQAVPFGDPAAADTLVGPVVNDSQLDGLRQKVEQAQRAGARTVLSGEITGRVVPPHVFADVTADMEIAREEIFGPMDRGVQFAQQVQSGMTYINEMTVQDEAHVAFGGERNSGLGRFNGAWAVDEFTTGAGRGPRSADSPPSLTPAERGSCSTRR